MATTAWPSNGIPTAADQLGSLGAQASELSAAGKVSRSRNKSKERTRIITDYLQPRPVEPQRTERIPSPMSWRRPRTSVQQPLGQEALQQIDEDTLPSPVHEIRECATERLDESRALVVVNNEPLAQSVGRALHQGGYVTRDAQYSREAWRILADWQPHLAVIELDPRGDELLERLGGGPGSVTRVPVLALIQRDDLKSRLRAFGQGVDDVVTIPVAPEELAARALAITRRAHGQVAPLRPTLRLGELELDLLRHSARLGSMKLHLSNIEQGLLYLLASNAGRLVTRDELLDTLWGIDCFPQSNVLDRHVCNLRAKLQTDSPTQWMIATIAGRGYRLVPPGDQQATTAFATTAGCEVASA